MVKALILACILATSLIAPQASAGEREHVAQYYVLRESNNELLAMGGVKACDKEEALSKILGRISHHGHHGHWMLPPNTKVLIWIKYKGVSYRIQYRTPQRHWHWGCGHVIAY